jgi:NAD(P)-dependent dehydrogenase (short-subunit alcohol dehydrogenase family)
VTATIRLDGQVAIVTGAGNGLGRSYALALAARGAAVVCNDFVADAAEAAAAEIVAAGGRAVAESSSVATPAGGAAIVAAALDAFDRVDVLVNNAGQLRNAAFADMTVDEFDAVIATHLAGAFHVTQPAFRVMQAAGYGRIVFTSSAAGLFGAPWQANYAAAKAGLLGLCNVVAIEGARHGILANALLPMALSTAIGRDAAADATPHYAPDDMQEIGRALGRLAREMTVDNVAPFVVYLASPQCRFTHRAFSVGAGHVAEVFVAASRGWNAPGLRIESPEQVEAELDAACDRAVFAVPTSIVEESNYIAANRPLVTKEPHS